MTKYHPHTMQNDLLRCYLLLWVCLISFWGLFEISSRAVVAAWSACSTGNGLPEICAQLKQHLGPQGQPDIASLPPALLTTLLLHAMLIFLLFLLIYGILLWFSFSGIEKQYLLPFLVMQGVLACIVGLFVPALSLTVPVSLLLVLILETCAVFKQVKTILAFSGGTTIMFLLIAVLAWKQGAAFHESSLPILPGLILLICGFLFVGGYFILYTRLAHMYDTLESAYGRLEAANAHIEVLTRTMERERMARELHDTLAQGLAGIILQLGVAHAHVREHHYDDVQSILEQTLASARETLTSAREAIDGLREHSPSNDLVEAVQEEVRRFTLLTGLPCATELDMLAQVPAAHTQQVLGIIREGLTNVARHAHASQAWVCASRDMDMLHLEIGDDGVGFEPDSSGMQPGHYGLLGLQERAHLAGGQLAVLSAPGQGTRIEFSLPLSLIEALVEKE